MVKRKPFPAGEPRTYFWRFSYGRKYYSTHLFGNHCGDMSIYQKNNSGERNVITLSQHSDRYLFMMLLKYFHQFKIEEGLSYLRDQAESGLLAKLAELPNRTGNFGEHISPENSERDVKMDFLYFNVSITSDPSKIALLPDGGNMTLDCQKSLLMYQPGNHSSILFTPGAAKELLYGIGYMAAHGYVRTSKRQLEDRIRFFNSEEFKDFEKKGFSFSEY